MIFLLDTHALLWALLQPHLLPAVVRSLIQDPMNFPHVSSATVWEIVTKHRLGKLPLAVDIAPRIDQHLARLGTTALPINHTHARVAASFTSFNKDPFDRILAAQAIVEGIPIATRDRFFTEVGAPTIW